MSSSSNPVRSGLGTVKRDWSQSAPKSSQEIEWEPTQPKPKAKPASSASQRLLHIQSALDAIAGNKPPPPLEAQRTSHKRPSAEGLNDENATVKKARVLPWKDNLATSSTSSGFGNDSISNKKTGSQSSISSFATKKTLPGSSKKVAPVFLSAEQTHILQLVAEGNNVFYTGSAGTGKSVLLREIVKTLRKKYVKYPDSVAVTASTGMAACNIGGVTLHSFCGLGINDAQPAEEAVTNVRKNKKLMSRWLRTKVLVIDEASMIDGKFFDKLAKAAKLIRRSEAPFGGIQLVVTGDFFQLPPVSKSNNMKFAFDAELWDESLKYKYNLTQVFRQRDQRFVDMLNELRYGKLSPSTIQEFRRLSRPIQTPDEIVPTELYPTRKKVDDSNALRMSRLNTEQQVYTCVDGGTIQNHAVRQKILESFICQDKVTLRVQSQVMLIKNYDETLVNGSVGIVEGFFDPAEYAKQEGAEAPGSTLGGGSGSMSKKASAATSASVGKKYPLVSFRLPNGSRRKSLILPEVFKVEQANGEVSASRTQIPLILSWAMSIHKSQGQTLDYVKVDLGGTFEKGQAYVALSRATSLEGLQIVNFDASKVHAHPAVIAWSKQLSVVETGNNRSSSED